MNLNYLIYMMIIVKMTLKRCLFTNRREVESICEELERADGASSNDDKKEHVQQSKGKEKAKKQSYHCRNRVPSPVDSTFMGAQFRLPPQNFDELTSFQVFKIFGTTI